MAVTSNLMSACGEEIVSLVSAWRELLVRPATPEIVVFWWSRGKQRPLTKRSETNDADEAESNKALAFTIVPSGASISTRQVMSNEVCARLAAALDETLASTLCVGVGDGGMLDIGGLLEGEGEYDVVSDTYCSDAKTYTSSRNVQV